MEPPTSTKAKIQSAEDALLALADKPADGLKQPTLLDHEAAIFRGSHALLSSQADFPELRIRILCHALRNRNQDLVTRLLSEAHEKSKCLIGQPDVLKALLLHRVPEYKLHPARKETDDIPEMLALLLRHGAPADMKSSHGKCPLYYACTRGYCKAFRILLEVGADPHRLISIKMSRYNEGDFNDKKNRCLSDLLQVVWREWAKWTVEKGVLDYRHATFEEGHGAILLHLLDLDLRIDVNDPDTISIYHTLCFHGDLNRVKTLTDLGVDVQAEGLHKEGPGFSVTFALQAATVGCQTAMVRLLLDNGALPRARGTVHKSDYYPDEVVTPLVATLRHQRDSVSRNHPESPELYNVCEILLDSGIDEDDLRSLLYYSIEKHWLQMVEDLLARGVRIPNVPLCLNTSIIDLVVQSGAFLNGKRFLQYALNRCNLELLKYLDERHYVRLELHDYPHVMLGLMRRYHYHQWQREAERRGEYIQVMRYLRDSLSLSVDSVLEMGTKTNREPEFADWFQLQDDSEFVDQDLCSTDEDAYSPIWTGDEVDQEGEQTSLLRLACEWELYPAVRWLVEDEGADTTCPGLPKTALEYYVERPPLTSRLLGDDLDERLVLVLLENSDKQNVERWKQRLAREIERNVREIDGCTMWNSRPSDRPAHVEDDHLMIAQSYLSPTSTFSYQRLQGLETIRLFRLDPATSLSDPISGSLWQYDPIDCPPFEALSYVWGDKTESVDMSLDQKSFALTRNLAAALTRLRSTGKARTLWVDAICINQYDHEEKGRQVSMMSNIYQRAIQVLVWIGEHADKSQLIIEWHRDSKEKIDDDTERLKSANFSPNFGYAGDVQAAFVSLCRRSYWYRTWILQEIGLSSVATVVCGPDTIDLKALMRFNKDDSWLSDYHPLRGPHATRHADNVAHLAIYRDISRIAMLIRHCQCKDPRDKVFGVLGLLDDRRVLKVDYDAPIEDVYRNFAKAIIQERDDLLPLHWLGPSRTMTGLNSWVPDWSISKPTGVLRRITSDERLGWELKGHPEFVFSDPELKLKGARLDTINAVGGVLSIPEDPSQTMTAFRTTMLQWEHLVFPEVQKHGIKALEAFAGTLHAEDKYCMNVKRGGRILFPFVMWYHHYGTGYLRTHTLLTFELVELAMAMLGQIQDWNDWKFSAQEKVWRYTEHMEVSCYGRQLYIAEKGSMGLAPPGTRVGDQVVFFPGGSYPFVVRSRDDGTWELIGDCHLEDLDVGVIKATPWESFTLL